MNELSFNSHDVILLLTGTLALLMAVPMLLRPRSRVADRTLAAFVLTQGGAALFYLLVYGPVFGPTMLRWFGAFEMMPLVILFLIQGPLLLRYSWAISGRPAGWLPVDRVILSIVFAHALIESAARAIWFEPPTFPLIPMAPATPALVVSIAYGIRAILVLRRHDEQIRQRFSNIEDFSLLWLSYAAVGFTGVWLLRFGTFFTHGIAGPVSEFR